MKEPSDLCPGIQPKLSSSDAKRNEKRDGHQGGRPCLQVCSLSKLVWESALRCLITGQVKLQKGCQGASSCYNTDGKTESGSLSVILQRAVCVPRE